MQTTPLLPGWSPHRTLPAHPEKAVRRSSLLLAPATALSTQATILSICPGPTRLCPGEVMQPGEGLRGKRHLDPLAGDRNGLREQGTRGNERFPKVLEPQERQRVAELRWRRERSVFPEASEKR